MGIKKRQAMQVDDAQEPASNKTIDSKKKFTKKMNTRKVILITALAAVVLVAIFLALMLFAGKSLNFTGEPSPVCGTDMIERHNSANLRGGSRDEEIKTIAKEVESTEGYKEDPTCVSIVYYYYAYQAYDYEKVEEYLGLMKTLVGEGKEINDALFSAETVEQMESHFEELDPNNEGNLYEKNEIVL